MSYNKLILIDSHAHLNLTDYKENLDEVILRAKEVGVEKIVNIGASMKDSLEAIELTKKYEFLYATVGVHPNDNPSDTVESIGWEKFEEMARQPKVVAIGETGLDYSRIPESQTSRNPDEKERQKKLFIKQIEMARILNLPLSIHIRDAQKDIIDEFSRTLTGLRGVFHCFSGNEEYLDFILEKLPNFYISFAGNATFRNAKELQELAKLVPLEKLLIETDCPFLSPEPYRGSRNEPGRVKSTAQKLADIKKLSFDKIARITTENAKRLFNF